MRHGSRRKRASLAVTAVLAGSTVFTSRSVVWSDAIKRGTEQFVLSLLDPSAIIEQLQQSDGE